MGRPLETNHHRYDFNLVGFDRSVEQFNLRRNPVFLLDDYPLPFAVNHLFFISVRVIHNARNEVRNEESCGVINPDLQWYCLLHLTRNAFRNQKGAGLSPAPHCGESGGLRGWQGSDA